MEADRHHLLLDGSASTVSLQDPPRTKPLYPSLKHIKAENSLLVLPGAIDDAGASEHRDDRDVSPQISRSSSVSTTTDDQAVLLRRSRVNSLEGPLQTAAVSDGSRRAKSAVASSGKRRSGLQHFGGELEKIKSKFAVKIPRTGAGDWKSDPESDEESKSSSIGERRVKSAALLLAGRSRVRVAPANLKDDGDHNSLTSSTRSNAWEPLKQDSPTVSQTSLITSGTKGPPRFGRARVQVSPAPQTEEADDTASSINSSTSRGIADTFVSQRVAVEEATGETVVRVQDDSSSTVASYHVEHQPYIPLQSAKEAIARVADDMQRMKEEHIHLVEQMQNAYQEIEEGSKVQYREYVQQLRKQHGSKMTVYKQVVKLLQEEMDNMKEYWEGTANSLSRNNRKLLLENKDLYRQLKDGLERTKQDKEKTVREMTGRIEVERKKREAEKKEAREEIDSLQAKCTDMVRVAEQAAEERLAKEKAVYEQSIVELEKKLAEEQTRLKDLERSLTLERASGLSSKVIVEKDVKTAAPVLIHSTESHLSSIETIGKVEMVQSQLSHAEEVKLKKKVGKAEKELRQAQLKLKSMMTLMVSEPCLRDAIEERIEEVMHEINSLESEREELKEEISELKSQTEKVEDEEANDINKSIGEKEARLSEIKSSLSQLEQKLELMQFLQNSEGNARQASVSTIPSKHSKVDQKEKVKPSTEDNNVSISQPQEAESETLDALDEAKSASVISVDSDSDDPQQALVVQESESDAKFEQKEEMEELKEVDLDSENESEDSEVESEEIHQTAVDKKGDNESVKDNNSEEIKPVEGDEEMDKESQDDQSLSKEVPKSDQSDTGKSHSALKKKTPSQQPGDSSLQEEVNKLREQVNEFKRQQQADKTKIKTLQKEIKSSSKSGPTASGGGGSIEDKRELKKKEKEIKELSKQHEIAKKNLEKIQAQLKSTDSELTSLKKDNEKLLAEMKEKNAEFQKLKSAAKNAVEAAEKAKVFEEEVKKQAAEIKTLTENYNSERVLRKKYYNLIEDMKGKIRVYCRARPLSGSEKARNNFSVIESPDEYTLNVKTSKGVKEFQFDQVFTPEHSQAKVFEDTKNLIQSAVDGYNVCIFAYGQTGSGKTYTMIGGKDDNNQIVAPGIAPRAFETIFELVDANRSKFNFGISCYMLELYNDKLLDLFQTSHKDPPRLDIKKDKKGLVVVHGAVVHHTDTAAGLMELFDNGSKNRHVSSTKMNAESSRSHLVVGIVIESTNITNGTVHRGKLSIVDLAGSERASKTGATPEQLKEAQSINKSLSALGDVISALSSGQDFVPYRNNKLTMLMQDSLGGNAKTLMFVNISPADYNAEETVISLTYAARVKLITNDASKNADNKEIARLKGVIARLKKGETVEDDD